VSTDEPSPILKHKDEYDYFELDTAEGVRKTVIFHEDDDGVPNFRMRRYVFEPGAEVPKHTNGVEHEGHILEGPVVVGLEDEEYEVEEGDSMFIPPGTVHWFRNETDHEVGFLCMVPIGDAEIKLIDDE
jgi:quercetin dioxygenase-like cupin family protein